MPGLSLHHSHGSQVLIPVFPDESKAQLETGSRTSFWLRLSVLHISFSIPKLWDVHIINSFLTVMMLKEHVRLLSLWGSALENNLIGVHSQPLHSRSCCLFVPLKGPRCHGTYLHFSFGALSCGHSPLCGSADIISFYTVDFMVGFAVCFTLRGCSLRK